MPNNAFPDIFFVLMIQLIYLRSHNSRHNHINASLQLVSLVSAINLFQRADDKEHIKKKKKKVESKAATSEETSDI